MLMTGKIVEQLSSLRRYAGLLTGSDEEGDALVTRTLECILLREVEPCLDSDIRLALFRALHEVWVPSDSGAAPDGEKSWENAKNFHRVVSPLERAAVILVHLEGFFVSEAAYVLRMEKADVQRRLDRAESKLRRSFARRILIVEDDLLLAMELEELVRSLGHRSIGPVATRGEAVRLAMQERPALILSDIQLSDGTSGIDAVSEIRHRMNVPVIYVTGFPHRLHDRQLEAASYVVPKPFSDSLMKSFIANALLRHGLAS